MKGLAEKASAMQGPQDTPRKPAHDQLAIMVHEASRSGREPGDQ
jgi:hypothetical protein